MVAARVAAIEDRRGEGTMASPVRAAVQDIKRLRTISSVLTRHGFSAVARRAGLGRFVGDGGLSRGEDAFEEVEGVEELIGADRSEAAVRFRRVLEDLGPTFVKLGQVLSTRPDLVPKEFLEELRKLQDAVSPMPMEAIRRQVESSLGATLEELFESFEEKPLAAASIGQVHRARLPDGTAVVVKVQRVGVGEQIRSDLDLLYYLARFLEATVEEIELYSPTAIVQEFERAILAELDFRQEARNVQEFGRNFAEVPQVSVPHVYEELTTSEVMTMEFVQAGKLASVEGGSELADTVLHNLLDAMVKMVLYDGFFHGDPHPGNIMVREDGSLIFIDFGLVGRLSSRQQDDLIGLILNVLTGDVDAIARALLEMGDPVGRVNLREFRADVERVRNKYISATVGDFDVSQFIQEVMDAAQYHRIRLNPNYAVLVKTAATIEGIMRRLKPDLDVMAIGLPYARDLALKKYSARKLAQSALSAAVGVSSFVTKVPQQLDQVLMDLEGGNLTVTVRNASLDQLGEVLNTLGTRLFLGVIASGLAVVAAMLLRPFDTEIFGVSVLLILGILAALSATTLFWWSLGWHVAASRKGKKLRLGPLMRLLRRE
ncbi:ABC transporter [Lujinxingia litoralis]|uniref:ABC transporter n=2 Tax=Lujinxingia litoralis TaxID=2211119 RepID=A0A328C2E5_9DELT|nr:ABC transporter [Lujinxingia litoralis]